MLTASVTQQLDGKPDMVIGMHFFNPPSRMTLLEIVHNEVNFIEEPDTLVAKVDEIASKLANGAPLAQKLCFTIAPKETREQVHSLRVQFLPAFHSLKT
jgi:hypothetical protein